MAIRKIKNDLFDRSYQFLKEFLKEFEKSLKTTVQESEGAIRIYLEWVDIESFAQEAYFLFDKDIANHLRSYEGKSHSRQFLWVPDSELAKPFEKYLRFEKNRCVLNYLPARRCKIEVKRIR